MKRMAILAASGVAAAGAASAAVPYEIVPIGQDTPAPSPTPTASSTPPPLRIETITPPPIQMVPMPVPPRMLPPAPPAPPPPRPMTRPVAPATPPSGWIGSDDYPAAALRRDEEGTVVFRLEIDETGAVTDCIILSSSYSESLDTATCRILRRRASFRPALDWQGKPARSAYRSAVKWQFPPRAPVPMTGWASTLTVTIGANGQLAGCKFLETGAPMIEEASPCVDIAELPQSTFRKLRGASTGPVTILVRYEHSVEGAAPAKLPMLDRKFSLVDTWTDSFDVDAQGDRSACEGTLDEHDLPMPVVTCDSWTVYPAGMPGKVTVSMRFYTTGDAKIGEALDLIGGGE